MAEARASVVQQLVIAAQMALSAKMSEIEAGQDVVTADELISAYVTLCNHALKAAKKHGANEALLVEPLRQIIFDLMTPKGGVM